MADEKKLTKKEINEYCRGLALGACLF